MLRLFVVMVLLLVFTITGCPKGGGTDSPPQEPTGTETGDEPATASSALDLAARGKEIFEGYDYSNTSLSCADCHAASKAQEQDKIFIAHSAYGAARRGAWKITKEEQLAINRGFAPDVIAAANVCVKASYMNHGDEPIEGDDAEALNAYLESIAVDDEPFIIAKATSLPQAGLTPDLENGKRIFEMSCAKCHDAGKEGIIDLDDANEWLNEVQLMAKIRKLRGDWYADYEGMTYASLAENPCAANPCNPCGESEAADEGYEEQEDEHGMFEENAMPFFATDILSDQDVVDVAFYIISGAEHVEEPGDEHEEE